MKLSEVLRKVADHEEVPGWDWNNGLCGNICNMTDRVTEKMALYFMQCHPEYSGRSLYPIAHDPDVLHGVQLDDEYLSNGLTIEAYKAQLSYMACQDDMYTGCYGKKRREMALYLSTLLASKGM